VKEKNEEGIERRKQVDVLDSSICGGRGVVTRRRNGGSTRNRTVSLASKENEEKERKKTSIPIV